MKTAKFNKLNNQSGLATIEAIPLLVIFVIFVAYGVGFFGTIHTAILHSIGARAYAFETFRNRTNLTFMRDYDWSNEHFANREIRFHAIQPEQNATQAYSWLTGTARPIAMGLGLKSLGSTGEDHNVKVYQLAQRNKTVGVNPVWVKVGYGICLRASCGQN